MATTETPEPTLVSPDTATADGPDRPPRRIRLPLRRRGRVGDTELFDQAEDTGRPARKIALPLLRRARDTELFDQAESTDRPARRIPPSLLRRGRVLDTAPPDQAESKDRPARRIPPSLLRRGRALPTAPFDPTSSHTVDTPAPRIGRRIEPTHRLEGFELRSVASVALCYYVCAFAVLAFAVVLAWIGASALGIVGQVEEFMRSIGFREFHFAGWEVIAGGVLLCAAGVAFLTVMTVLAAAFFNLLARPQRGVAVRLAPISESITPEESSRSTGNGDGNATADARPNARVKANGNGNGKGNGDGKATATAKPRVKAKADANAAGNGNGHRED